VDLLSAQHFPKEWKRTLGRRLVGTAANYHLNAIPTGDPSIRSVSLTPLTEEPHPAGQVNGDRAHLFAKDTGQEGLLAARYRLAGLASRISGAPIQRRGTDFRAGSWILPASPDYLPRFVAWQPNLALDFHRVPTIPACTSCCQKLLASVSGCLGRTRILSLDPLRLRPASHSLHLPAPMRIFARVRCATH